MSDGASGLAPGVFDRLTRDDWRRLSEARQAYKKAQDAVGRLRDRADRYASREAFAGLIAAAELRSSSSYNALKSLTDSLNECYSNKTWG